MGHLIENYHLENLKIYRDDVYSVKCIRDNKFTNVAEGDFRGRHFVIGINWFGVPVLYIECKDEDHADDNNGEDFVGKIGQSGGWRDGDDRRYFGWDYGHAYSRYEIFLWFLQTACLRQMNKGAKRAFYFFSATRDKHGL